MPCVSFGSVRQSNFIGSRQPQLQYIGQPVSSPLPGTEVSQVLASPHFGAHQLASRFPERWPFRAENVRSIHSRCCVRGAPARRDYLRPSRGTSLAPHPPAIGPASSARKTVDDGVFLLTLRAPPATGKSGKVDCGRIGTTPAGRRRARALLPATADPPTTTTEGFHHD